MARWSPAPSTAASSRSGSRRSSRSCATRTTDPVHRRAAHAGRRGRRRRRDRRGEHAQAGAGARRAPVHRRDHARRVPQVHREGRRARAPLPAGHGRGADARGDDRDPQGLRERYEEHHQVKITDEAVEAAADLSIRYITDRFLPDKAIDVIDEAAQPRPPAPLAPRRRTLREAQKELDRDHQGEGSGGRRPGLRARPHAARREATPREKVDAAGSDWQATSVRRPADGRRGRHRPGRRDVDRHPGHAHRAGGVRAAAADGGRAPQAGHRPGRGDQGRLARPSVAAAPVSRIRSGRSARSSSSGPRASARRSSPRRSPSSCSATRTR